MGILVRATKLGWYGKQRRRPGAEFEIKSLQELGAWMVRVNKPGPKKKDDEQVNLDDNDATGAEGRDTGLV